MAAGADSDQDEDVEEQFGNDGEQPLTKKKRQFYYYAL